MTTKNHRTPRTIERPPQPPPRTAWGFPALLVALSIVPVVGGGARLASLATGEIYLPDSARFFADPAPAIMHIVSVTIFCLLGAAQFSPSFRRRQPRWHRSMGRPLFAAGSTAAVTGLWLTLSYPPAAHDGQVLFVVRIVVATAMMLAIVLSGRALLRRNYSAHGAWMTRAYAIGLGAGTQVLTHLPFVLQGEGLSITERTIAMTLGWVINIVVAEVIIRTARTPTKRPAGLARPHVAMVVPLALMGAACSSTSANQHAAAPPTWAADTAAQRDDGWTLSAQDLDDDDGWQVFERDDPKTGLRAFRVVSVIDAEPQRAADAYRTRMREPQFLDEGQTRRIIDESEDVLTVQSVMALPFPFSSRESTERIRFHFDEQTGISRVEALEMNDIEPPPGAVRLPVMKTWTTFVPLDDHRSRVTLETIFDLGGYFPSFVVEAGAGEGLVEEIALLRTIATQEQHAAPVGE